MSSSHKHLVLEDDVHRYLKAKKDLTGLSIREIGNEKLRSCFGDPHLRDIIGNILVGMEKLSQSEYQFVLEQAALEAKKTCMTAAPPVSRTQQGTLISGSWEIANTALADDGLFQILEWWARDDNRHPMDAHSHASDEFLIMLSGRSSLTVCGTHFVLGPRSVTQIPAGDIHAVTPLDATAHLLAILTPAVPEYRFDKS